MLLKLAGVAVFVLLLFGFSQRSNRRIHIPVMLLAFALDMSLLGYIEFARGAVEQMVGPTSPIMKVHLSFSITTVALYFVQITSGVLRARGHKAAIHGYTGMSLLIFRFGNLVTSFLIPTHNLG